MTINELSKKLKSCLNDLRLKLEGNNKDDLLVLVYAELVFWLKSELAKCEYIIECYDRNLFTDNEKKQARQNRIITLSLLKTLSHDVFPNTSISKVFAVLETLNFLDLESALFFILTMNEKMKRERKITVEKVNTITF